jgi:hypothetical protein
MLLSATLQTLVLAVSTLAIARRPGEGLGLPVIGLMSFAFLYIIQPLFLAHQGQLDLFLTDAQITKALLWPAIVLACFMAGWLKRPTRPPRAPLPGAWIPARLWCFGLFTAVAGFALYAIFIARSGGAEVFYSLPHGGGAAWTDNTAYLYMGPWWALAGIAMMLLAACRIGGERWRWAVPILCTLGLLANAILMSSRGYLFATAVVSLAAVAIGKQWDIRFWKAVPPLIAAGLAVLGMLAFRSVLHLGERTTPVPGISEAFASIMSNDAGSTARRVSGNEFIVHGTLLDTVDATRKYHYALPWLYVFLVHPVPRVLWPNKPYGFEPLGVGWSDVFAHTGVVIADGSAPGIVADIYYNFGWFSILFFWIFGALTRRLYANAMALTSPLACLAYVMLLGAGLNCFAQGVGAVLVPYSYSLLPVFLFTASQRAFAPRALAPCHP